MIGYCRVAFDVYPLTPQPSGGSGRVGRLARPTALLEFAEKVKRELQSGGVQVVGEPTRMVSRIAVACGAAGEFLADARAAKADVFVTGEMRFHDSLSAEAQGIALVLPGHYATERPAVEDLATRIAREFSSLAVWASRAERDPVAWV